MINIWYYLSNQHALKTKADRIPTISLCYYIESKISLQKKHPGQSVLFLSDLTN